jgi:hypothetical protein
MFIQRQDGERKKNIGSPYFGDSNKEKFIGT